MMVKQVSMSSSVYRCVGVHGQTVGILVAKVAWLSCSALVLVYSTSGLVNTSMGDRL